LVGSRTASNSDIDAKVAELIAGKPDFGDKLSAITQFMQSEIRYVAIEIGVGGAQPHPATDVFHFRYGDCKDKVTLLKAMLQVAGIRSFYVLIDTDRGFINPAVPSSWANHAIIAIELPGDIKTADYRSVVTVKSGKRYIIFDPTDEYTPVGSLRSQLQSSYALLVMESAGELIRTLLMSPDLNVISRTGHFTLSADGSLSGEVSEEQSGDFASHERGMLRGIDERERDRLISQNLGRSIQGFSLDNIKFQQTDQLQKSLLMSFRVTTPLYGQTRGLMMLVRPRVFNDESYPVEHKTRQFPIELRRTGRQIDTYEIEIPNGYSVDDVPDPVKIEVGFATYQSKVEAQGNKLRYWREYVVKDLSVPPDKYSDWVRLEGAIGADEAAVAVLKRTQ
jgi:Transglutaminase-like superfamily